MVTHKLLLVLFGTLLAVPFSVGAASLVNINTAGTAELDTLPGIGPAKAAAIVAYRTEHGPFAATEEIQEVKGIGPSTYEGLKSLITVGEVAPTAAKPSATSASSYTKQTQPAAPTSNVTTDDHALRPTVTQESAAALAAAPQASTQALTASPWTLGFLALLLVAGGALLVL